MKILAIDGGGIRGLIPAMVLEHIENATQKKTAQMFDLIAGTSTGGIIGLEVCSEIAARDCVKLYSEHGGEIFTPPSFFRRWALFDRKYDHRSLEELLRRTFQHPQTGEQRTLDSASKPLLVSSYDIENREPFFFKSWHPYNRKIPMWEVARATSAVPTYFEPKQIRVDSDVHTLVAGGIFVNNPAMSAYAEAIRLHNEKIEEVKTILALAQGTEESQLQEELNDLQTERHIVVSLGTGLRTDPLHYEETRDWGLLSWARPAMDITFDAVSDAVDYQLGQILGNRYYRFQTGLIKATDAMDDVTPENIQNLRLDARRLILVENAQLNTVCRLL